MARLNAAMERIDAACAVGKTAGTAGAGSDNPGSERVLALVNAHEKLREEVADTIGEIDALIEELEG